MIENYAADTFGKLNAEDYDARHDPGTTEEAVSLLFDLASGRRTLELAVGTGRIALPLAERGLDITGFDASQEMIDRLNEKPGGPALAAFVADMAEVALPPDFGFAFLIFNTLYNLTTQEDQIACFRNTAAALQPGGHFLVEAFVPDPGRFDRGQSVRVRRIEDGEVTLEAAMHDPVTQLIEHQYVRLSAAGPKLTPLPMRYAWPAEIDLMARLAGLELEARWGYWDRRPFTAESGMNISLYRKPR